MSAYIYCDTLRIAFARNAKHGRQAKASSKKYFLDFWLTIFLVFGVSVAHSAPTTPTGLSPGSTSSPGPVVSGSSVTLSWSAVSGATYYDFGVTDINAGTFAVDTTSTTTSYTASLAAGKPYRWNIRACNTTGCSAFTALRYFQTPAAAPAIPATPTGLSPGTTSSPGTVLSGTSVTLSWSAVSGATYYDFGVTDINAGTFAVDTTSTTTSYTASLASGKPYRWNIRACNTSGCSGFTTLLYFQTPGTILTAPNGLSPGTTSAPGPVLSSNTVTLSWGAVSGATYYDFGVTDINAGTFAVDTTSTTTSYTASLAAGKPYRWNIRACNTSGCSAFTALRYFQTPGLALSIPATPNGLSPGSTSTPGPMQSGSTVTVSWNASSGATLYIGGITDIAAGSAVKTINTSSTSTAATLSPGKQYRWYVYACNSTGCSNSSAFQYFQTPVPITPTPQCTLTATPSTIILGSSTTLTATCIPAATSYAWTPATGLVPGPANTASVTPTARGTHEYSVTGSNTSGAGNMATTLLNVRVPLEQTPAAQSGLTQVSNSASWPNPASRAVVITHGWNADANGWVKEMAEAFCTKLGVAVNYATSIQDLSLTRICQANNWDVWVVDWASKAAPVSISSLGLPMDAYVNAIDLGRNLASILTGKNYSHVHLIAHSAGSNLIEFATSGLKYYQPEIKIHNTFLDAYDPVSDASRYGEKANWADNYVDTRDVFDVRGLDGTKLFLRNAYNVDVTTLIPNLGLDPCGAIGIVCRHSRPYRFYGLSVDPQFVGNSSHKDADPVNDGTGGKGYPLSVENGQSLTSLSSILPKGTKCVMGNGICYQGSLPPSFWHFLPGELVNTVVNGVTGTVNYAAGLGAILLNSLEMTAGSLQAGPGIQSASKGSVAAATIANPTPAWITVQSTTTQPVNTLRFNLAFVSAAEGLLRIYVDDTPVLTIDQRYVPAATLTTEEIFIGGDAGTLPPGNHKIAFRLDSFGANASSVALTNVELLFVTATVGGTVPDAPTTISATAGNGSATVTFTSGALGSGTLINYTADCGGITNTGGGSPITVTGLTNGVSYTCTVNTTTTIGSSAWSAPSQAIVPSASVPLSLVSVASRKTHGASGAFDVTVDTTQPIGGTITVEPRQIGAGHAVIFSFNGAVTAAGNVSVENALGAAVGTVTPSVSGNNIVVALTGIPDNQRIRITLTNVNGVATPFTASLGFLVGDVNDTRTVNSSDISGVKARSGQTTSASNFRNDVNASGNINSSDISAVKARSGLTLP